MWLGKNRDDREYHDAGEYRDVSRHCDVGEYRHVIEYGRAAADYKLDLKKDYREGWACGGRARGGRPI